MLRVVFAVVLFWALSTSGLTAGDVAGALVTWAADHIEITTPAADHDRAPLVSERRPESGIDVGPFTIRTTQ